MIYSGSEAATNLARGKPATQSSTLNGGVASRAVDIDIERRDWPTLFPDISRCMQTRRPSWVGAPKAVATCK